MEEKIQLMRGVLDTIDVVVWATDVNGIVTLSEGAGLKSIGLEPGQIVGQNAFELYRDNADLCEKLRRALQGETFVSDVRIGDRILENRYAPLYRNGEIVGVVGTSTDVTERRRADQELKSRVETIERQRAAMRAMAIPIIQVWDGVLAVPIIGLLDSERAALLMESVLREVTSSRARYAILDLTGVDVVDTATADHLFQVVRAVRLLGAAAIVTGIQPSMANVLVSIGVELGEILTLRTLQDAIQLSMRGASVSSAARFY
jgi:rsbT co-antagonist protein RsbR